MKVKEKEFRLRKRLAAGVLAGCAAFFMAGCGGADTAYSSKYNMSTAAESADYSADFVSNGYSGGSAAGAAYADAVVDEAWGTEADFTESGNVAAASSRKLIRTVHMDVETKEFERLMNTLESQVEEMGGYIESMDTYNGSSYSDSHRNRYANLTIRIPQAKLSSFLNTVSEVGNVVSRSESVEDVTLTYVDMESRKEMLLVEQERLLALLEKAESLEDIFTIENRLSQVRYQVESMESQLRTYDNQVDYSTIYLYVDEVQELTPVEEKTVWQRMGDGFADSVESMISGFAELGIWFVAKLPFLVVWGIVIALAVTVFKKLRRKKEKKFAERQQSAAETGEHENR